MLCLRRDRLSLQRPSPPPEATAKPTYKTYRPAGYKRLAGSIYSDRGALSPLYSDDGSRLELSAARNSSGTYVSDFYAHATMAAAERAALTKLSAGSNGNASSSYAALSLYVTGRGLPVGARRRPEDGSDLRWQLRLVDAFAARLCLFSRDGPLPRAGDAEVRFARGRTSCGSGSTGSTRSWGGDALGFG